MAATVAGLVAIPAAFALLAAALAVFRRSRRVDPEILRKGLHAGMGIASLALPCFFDAVWPVLGLALGFALALGARAWCSPLRRILGPILDGVGRPTVGEPLFPVAVAITYAGAGSDRIAFAIPILVLALADSAAALTGRRFGTARYGGSHGKSLEGSAAFFAAALCCVAIPLLVYSGRRPAPLALISLSVALVATLVEAVSRHGLDNLSVPLITLLLVRTLPSLGLVPLALLLAGISALALLALAAALRGGTRRRIGWTLKPLPGSPRVSDAGLPAGPLRSGPPETRRGPCRA